PIEGNAVARRVIDDLVDFSGDTSVDGYIRFFKAHQLVETRLFVNRMREEAQTSRNMIGQLTALIPEMEAFDDPGEVFDTLMGLRDDIRVEEAKLAGLNDLITQGEEELRSSVGGDGWVKLLWESKGMIVFCFVDYAGCYVHFAEFDVNMLPCFFIKVTTSPGNFLNMYSLIASASSFLGVRIALTLRVPLPTARTHWLNSCFDVSISPFGEYSLALMLPVSVKTLQYLHNSDLFMQAWTTSGLLAFGITGKIYLKSPPSNMVMPSKFCCFFLSP
nr:hypothetical protein [Tanacetum cinerariifolium]